MATASTRVLEPTIVQPLPAAAAVAPAVDPMVQALRRVGSQPDGHHSACRC